MHHRGQLVSRHHRALTQTRRGYTRCVEKIQSSRQTLTVKYRLYFSIIFYLRFIEESSAVLSKFAYRP